MSAFSDVDRARDPARLVASLAESAQGLASMKHYMGVAHRLRGGLGGLVLDVGCGSGHDMSVLDALGVASVGVDPSSVMLSVAQARTSHPVARATGEALPFRDGAFAGCWVERVLMHVVDPTAVLREVIRCAAPGGLLTVFEPDWSSLTVNGSRVPAAWATSARQPSIGAQVGALLQAMGCFVRDRVEERSWWTFDEFEAITSQAITRTARTATSQFDEWLDEIRTSARLGTFTAEMVKVMWVATTPA